MDCAAIRAHVGAKAWFATARKNIGPSDHRVVNHPITGACRRPRVGQGQAFGDAEEKPSVTVTVRDGDGNMRSGRKNARSAGRTKNEATKQDKNGVMHP